MDNDIGRLAIAKILERADAYEWSLQGFGMLRLYLSKEVRLHVWDDAFATPDVTQLHDHPWHFTSTIVGGMIRNSKYLKEYCTKGERPTHYEQQIICGPGGCAKGEKVPVVLKLSGESIHTSGDTYSQSAPTIHATWYESGTITVISRIFQEDTEHAKVFVPVGKEWISAEPRKATALEVNRITAKALVRLRREMLHLA